LEYILCVFDTEIIRAQTIAQTALLLNDEKQNVLEVGCNDIVLKPIDQKLLLGKIKEHLQI